MSQEGDSNAATAADGDRSQPPVNQDSERAALASTAGTDMPDSRQRRPFTPRVSTQPPEPMKVPSLRPPSANPPPSPHRDQLPANGNSTANGNASIDTAVDLEALVERDVEPDVESPDPSGGIDIDPGMQQSADRPTTPTIAPAMALPVPTLNELSVPRSPPPSLLSPMAPPTSESTPQAAGAESNSVGAALGSAPVVAVTSPPPSLSLQPAKRSNWALILGLAVAVIVGGVIGAAQLGESKGSLLVKVNTEEQRAITNLRVLVNGQVACRSQPCNLSLTPGTHFVRTEAEGFTPTAARAVIVEADQATVVPVTLTLPDKPADPASNTALAAGSSPAALPEPTAAQTEQSQPAPTSIAAHQRAQPKATKQLKSTAAKDATQPSTQNGQSSGNRGIPRPAALNLNSIPASNVLLDGRPIGKTPLLNVSVKPGKHSVTFLHPKRGRKTVSVEVGAGAKRTVTTRF